MAETRITQLNHPPGLIDLGSGNPDPALYPFDDLKTAADRYFAISDPRTLQYGAEQGNGLFLQVLSNFLTLHYGFKVEPRNLFATTGASSALDLLCTLFTRPGDTVFVEEPSYFLALRIFADHGLRVMSLPMDENGLQVESIEESIMAHKPKFIYTVPTFHNPASLTLSRQRREHLVRISQKHNTLIFADEVYHFLSYTQAPPPPFASYSNEIEQVISINSFSKILAPGLRMGWIQAHENMIRKLTRCGLLDSGGGMNPFTSAILQPYIEAGDLDGNIAALKMTYSTRLQAMTAALNQYLPGAEYHPPQGGFFVWIHLPGVDASALRPQARGSGVDFRPGPLFSSQDRLKEYLRLSFSYYDPEKIKEGVVRLGRCLSVGDSHSRK